MKWIGIVPCGLYRPLTVFVQVAELSRRLRVGCREREPVGKWLGKNDIGRKLRRRGSGLINEHPATFELNWRKAFRKLSALVESRFNCDVAIKVHVTEFAVATDGDQSFGVMDAIENDRRFRDEISRGVDNPFAVFRFDARTALRKRKSERVRPQNEIPRAIIKAGTASCFLLSKQEAIRSVRGRQASKNRLGDPGSARIDDADWMFGQTCIHNRNAAVKTLRSAIAKRNNFHTASIDVAPAALIFGGCQTFREWLHGFKTRRDYDVAAIIDKSPRGPYRCGKERSFSLRLIRAASAEGCEDCHQDNAAKLPSLKMP